MSVQLGHNYENQTHDYCVPAGATMNLEKWPTKVPDIYRSKKHYEKTLGAQVEALSDLQRAHYASTGMPCC